MTEIIKTEYKTCVKCLQDVKFTFYGGPYYDSYEHPHDCVLTPGLRRKQRRVLRKSKRGLIVKGGEQGMLHELKCWDVYYDAIERGEKTFEVRRDDRGFQKGDVVELQRCTKCRIGAYDVQRDFSTGKPLHVQRFRIAWILTGGQFGIEPGYMVFSLAKGGE